MIACNTETSTEVIENTTVSDTSLNVVSDTIDMVEKDTLPMVDTITVDTI